MLYTYINTRQLALHMMGFAYIFLLGNMSPEVGSPSTPICSAVQSPPKMPADVQLKGTPSTNPLKPVPESPVTPVTKNVKPKLKSKKHGERLGPGEAYDNFASPATPPAMSSNSMNDADSSTVIVQTALLHEIKRLNAKVADLEKTNTQLVYDYNLQKEGVLKLSEDLAAAKYSSNLFQHEHAKQKDIEALLRKHIALLEKKVIFLPNEDNGSPDVQDDSFDESSDEKTAEENSETSKQIAEQIVEELISNTELIVASAARSSVDHVSYTFESGDELLDSNITEYNKGPKDQVAAQKPSEESEN